MAYISDLAKGSNMPIRIKVFIRNTEEREGARGPYTKVTFTDGKKEESANVWVPVAQFPYKGKIVDMDLSLNANGFYAIDLKSVDIDENAPMSDFIPCSPVDTEKAMQEIRNTINMMGKRLLVKKVVSRIFEANAEAFSKWSAAKSMHHNYFGGLIYHELRMLRAGKFLAQIYNLDPDYLFGGIILHDIGKLRELTMDELGNAEYSVEGNLFGHLYIGAEMIHTACIELGIDPESEEIMVFKHMILSHHGEMEYGAVRPPMTKEALALCMLDDFDSKIWRMEEAEKSTESGTMAVRSKGKDLPAFYNRI